MGGMTFSLALMLAVTMWQATPVIMTEDGFVYSCGVCLWMTSRL